MTCLERECVIVTEGVVDVLVGSVCRRSTVDLVVSQRQRNTLGDTESYVKVHQTTAALQVLSLYTRTEDRNVGYAGRVVALQC